MEPILETEGATPLHQLNQVTPLSKYLAMILFIALPFIGAWLGYTFAPVKIMEVEKVIIKEVPAMNTEVTEDSATTTPSTPPADTSGAQIETVRPEIGIFSPEEDDQFCLGDPIEINYTVPKSVKSVSLSLEERPAAIAANIRTIQDTPGDNSSNTFLWDQTDSFGAHANPSYAHRIHIWGFENGDTSKPINLQSGIFAIIDCNIQ